VAENEKDGEEEPFLLARRTLFVQDKSKI